MKGFRTTNDHELNMKVSLYNLVYLLNLNLYFSKIPKMPLIMTEMTKQPFLSRNPAKRDQTDLDC